MSVNMVNNMRYGNYGYYQNRYNREDMDYYNYPEIDRIERPVKKDNSCSTGAIVTGVGATIGALYLVKKGKGKAFAETVKKAFSGVKAGISKLSLSKKATIPPVKSPLTTAPIKVQPSIEKKIISKATVDAVAPKNIVSKTVQAAKPTTAQQILEQPVVEQKILPKVASTARPAEIAKTTKAAAKTEVAKPSVAKEIQPKTATVKAPATASTSAVANATFESAKAEFSKIPECNLCKGAKGFIAELKPHSYGADKSMVSVSSIGHQGYEQAFVNSKSGAFPKVATPRCESGQRAIIGSLPDGRKFVSLGLAPGRHDFAGRNFQNTIKIVSDGKDFTPLQKDLIDIISSRAKTPFSYQEADILSLGMFNKGSGYYSLGFDKDIFLSSIATAKQQAAGKIDETLVKKALSLPSGVNLTL